MLKSTGIQTECLGFPFQASLSLAPVNIFKAGADEERAETARLVSLSRLLVNDKIVLFMFYHLL